MDKNITSIRELLLQKKQSQQHKDTHAENMPRNCVIIPKFSLMRTESSSKGADLSDIEWDACGKGDDENLNQIMCEDGTQNRTGNDSGLEHMDVDDENASSEDKDDEIASSEDEDEDDEIASSEDEDDELDEELLNLMSQPEAKKLKYNAPDVATKWVLMSIGYAWRHNKSRMKKKHFYAYNNYTERWVNLPRTILEIAFKELLALWNQKAEKKHCALARERSKSQKDRHTAGPKSFARVHEEMKNENPDKVPPSTAQLYERTRQRKEGRKYADPYNGTAEKIEAMKKYKPAEGDSDADAFLAVMGKEYEGRQRIYGRGFTNQMLKKVNGSESSYMVS